MQRKKRFLIAKGEWRFRKPISGTVLALLLASMLTVVSNIQPVKSDYVWTETIYIRADGSIDPPTAPISTVDNITYTFLDNINDSIIVEKNDIVIDGNGYTLQGTGIADSRGIGLTATRRNVTIKNANIFNFSNGIYLNSCLNCSIYGNNITNNDSGIYLTHANNNSITENNIIASNLDGIYLSAYSNNNSIIENNMTSSGIFLPPSSGNDISRNTFTDCGLEVIVFQSDIHAHVEDNTVNGRPLVYLEGATDYRVGDAGQVILVNCTGIQVENLNLSRTNIGIQLWRTNNTSVTNNTITNNRVGIALWESSNYNKISDNNVSANDSFGIQLWESSNYNNISDNNIKNNFYGIYLSSSSNNSICGNNLTANTLSGIELSYVSKYNVVNGNTFTDDGLEVYMSIQNYVENNTVNGKPLVYLERVADYIVGDAGQVILVNCTGIQVENLNLSRTNIGIQLWWTNNTSVTNNTITNNLDGIELRHSHDNSIGGNIITDNLYGGIDLDRSIDNSISGNIITNNSYGIMLQFDCSNNTISGNTIATNENGISLRESSGSSFYHNNFIYNTRQVYDALSPQAHSINEWDSDYPSGGNYWSDYNGTDANYDGIGDTVYIVNENNTDRYPLMTPYIIPEFQSFLILPLFMLGTLLVVIICRKKRMIKIALPQ